MKWIKWHTSWLQSTIRDQLLPAERATFHDMVCLAGLDDSNLGHFKIASWDSLARKFNTPLEIILSTRDKCLNDRISVSNNPQSEIIVSVLNWEQYQGVASKKADKPQKLLAKFPPRREEKRLEEIIVEPPLPPPPATTATTTATKDTIGATRDTSFAAICKAYESEIGMLTPHIGDQLQTLYTDSPDGQKPAQWAGWIVKAIGYAANQNKRNLAYILATLKGWQSQGWEMKSKAKGGQHGAAKEPIVENAELRRLKAAIAYEDAKR